MRILVPSTPRRENKTNTTEKINGQKRYESFWKSLLFKRDPTWPSCDAPQSSTLATFDVGKVPWASVVETDKSGSKARRGRVGCGRVEHTVVMGTLWVLHCQATGLGPRNRPQTLRGHRVAYQQAS